MPVFWHGSTEGYSRDGCNELDGLAATKSPRRLGQGSSDVHRGDSDTGGLTYSNRQSIFGNQNASHKKNTSWTRRINPDSQGVRRPRTSSPAEPAQRRPGGSLRVPSLRGSGHPATDRLPAPGLPAKHGLVVGRKEGLWVYYRLAKPKTGLHRILFGCLGTCLGDPEVFRQDQGRLKQGVACCGGEE